MRRQLFVSLVLLGAAMLVVLQLTGNLSGPGVVDNGNNVRMAEFTPSTPPALPNIPNMQTSLDRVSREALDGQWVAASAEVTRLENMWRSLRADGATLEIEEAISKGIESLHLNVLRRNVPGVLEDAEKLTGYFSQLRQ